VAGFESNQAAVRASLQVESFRPQKGGRRNLHGFSRLNHIVRFRPCTSAVSCYKRAVPIPAFDDRGELPVEIHRATLAECFERFGKGSEQRGRATATLVEICDLAKATGKLDRIIIFGSYVTAKREPRDIDIILVMKDDFDVETCSQSSRLLFDHAQADYRLGASIFWIRPAMLVMAEPLETFVARWQIKRDGGRRGILEVVL